MPLQQGDFILIDYNKAAEIVTKDKIKEYLEERASEVHKDRTDILDAIKECYYEKKSVSLNSQYIMNQVILVSESQMKHQNILFVMIVKI